MNYYVASYPRRGLYGTVVLHIDDADTGEVRVEVGVRHDETPDAASKRLIATLGAFWVSCAAGTATERGEQPKKAAP